MSIIPLSDYVSVTIAAESALQSADGFRKVMIIDSEYVYGGTGRVLTVSGLKEMVDAGYNTYNRAYRMAQVMLSQTPRPTTIKIGQWNDPGAETLDDGWAAIIAADSDFYWTVLTDRSESNLNNLAALVASAPGPYFYYAETADAAVLTAASGNVAEDIKNLGNENVRVVYKAATPQVLVLTVSAETTAGTFTGSIDATALSDVWAADHDTTMAALASDIAATAGVTSAVVSSSGALGVLDDTITITSSDALILNKFSITTNYTGGAFSQSVTTQASAPLSAAMAGYLAPFLPGQKIEAFARVKAVAPDSFSAGQRIALLSNNVGYFSQIGQRNSMAGGQSYGKVAAGSLYVDLKVLIDWLTIEIQTNVMSLLQGGAPIPYTTNGIESVKQAIAAACAEGVARGVILPSGDVDDGDLGTIGYTVTAPALSGISDGDKGARHLPNVSFQARPAGAIQQVTIRGTLTL